MPASDTAVQLQSEDAARSGAGPAGAGDRSSLVDEFLIARGGPLYDLQQRLGLLREHGLQAGRRAAILVGLAWSVPALLSAFSGDAIGPAASRSFRLDPAIGIFVLRERLVGERRRQRRGLPRGDAWLGEWSE